MRRSVPLGRLTASAFLRRYWQKSPHLIRRAIPGFKPPISIESLLELACTEGVEARLVQRVAKRPHWQVAHGPFTKKMLRALPATNWTLLVQDCDKHLPQLAEFLTQFDFVPNWRIDDLMISYAAPGGSVGPHVDAYDVFLLQAHGQRRWDISCKPQRPYSHPRLDLKLVKPFKPEHRWILKPGDMLCLPPGVAHHGVALEESLTFSIGMRMPSDAELLADLNSVLLKNLGPQSRYRDRNLKSAHADPGKISTQALATIRRRLRSAQHLPDAAIDEWFGCFITEPKPWLAPPRARRRLNAAGLRRKLAAGVRIERHPAARCAWIRGPKNATKLFVNGRCYTLPPRLAGLAKLLCAARMCSAAQLRPWLQDHAAEAVLLALYNAGLLRFE